MRQKIQQMLRQSLNRYLAAGKAKFNKPAQVALKWYKKYERFVPIAFFVIGFTIDSLFLEVDNLSDHIWLLICTILAGALILLTGLIKTGQISNARILRFQKWYPFVLQYCFGTLFSAYVVYYFKSAAVSQSIIFLGLLFALLIANEFLGDKLSNISLLCTLYFFTTFAFLTFFIPILSRSISSAMFYSSGVLSFLITTGIVSFIYRKIYRQHPKRVIWPAASAASVFGIMIFFYLMNWIPPVPLAMKESGIYHSLTVERSGEHLYKMKYYRRYPFQFWVTDASHFKYAEGDTVFCYASIFAPPGWKEKIDFRWQRYDSKSDKYLTTDVISYPINHVPGRRAGYRGYTFKRNVTPGDWRIDVEIETGTIRQVLGRMTFEVVPHTGERGRERIVWR